MIKALFSVLALAAVSQAHAFGTEDFTINGFGNQDYRQTTSNDVSTATSNGTWNNNFLGLVGSAKINDKSRVWMQLQSNSMSQTRFTWMYIDYAFTDNLTAHAGRVKLPYGLFNEYIYNKALQMSVTSPLAYQDGMAFDAYNGLGADWHTDMGAGGSLIVQGYGGNVYAPPTPLVNGAFVSNQSPIFANTNDTRLLGARFTWNAPLNGLRMMLSGNTTQVSSTSVLPVTGQTGNENRGMASAEYVNDKLTLQSEYNYHRFPSLGATHGVIAHAWYAQSAYNIGQWSPFARYDMMVTDQSQASNPNYYQRAMVFGTNYKIDKNVNFRVQESFNNGYALPVSGQYTSFTPFTPVGAMVANGAVSHWNEFAAEINFMF